MNDAAPTYAIRRDQAIRDILRLEAIDAGIANGRCTARCTVTVDPVVEDQTTIWHNGEAFPIRTDESQMANYWRRQHDLIERYVRWSRQFHPASEAWMT